VELIIVFAFVVSRNETMGRNNPAERVRPDSGGKEPENRRCARSGGSRLKKNETGVSQGKDQARLSLHY
jgi:hypothetical protein